jgi:hypothetical protein
MFLRGYASAIKQLGIRNFILKRLPQERCIRSEAQPRP